MQDLFPTEKKFSNIEVVNKYLEEKSPPISGDDAAGPSSVRRARLNTQQANRLCGREPLEKSHFEQETSYRRNSRKPSGRNQQLFNSRRIVNDVIESPFEAPSSELIPQFQDCTQHEGGESTHTEGHNRFRLGRESEIQSNEVNKPQLRQPALMLQNRICGKETIGTQPGAEVA